MWREDSVWEVLEMPEVIRCALLCMLEAVEDRLCSLEALEVLRFGGLGSVCRMRWRCWRCRR